MAYTINSAKDSQGNEDQYVADFAKNQRAILAYKQQHGGALEDAYQAVTGKPWPSGRSVKLKNGAPEMTKDRTVKSVLGKYVAPIAAGIAAPYLLPLIAGGGAAAGGAAAGGVGIGETAAVTGLAGSGLGTAAATSSLWSNPAVLGTIIGAGANTAGQVIANRANGKAIDAQTAATDKALALQKEQYDLQRQDNAPYRQMGANSLAALAKGLGFPAYTPEPSAAPAAPGTPPPPGVPMAPASQNSQPVQMKAPDGRVVWIPPDRVQEAEQRGASRV